MTELLHEFSTFSRRYSAILIAIVGAGLSYVFISLEFWSIVAPVVGATAGAFIAAIWVAVAPDQSISSTETSSLPLQVPLIVMATYVMVVVAGTRFYLYTRPSWLYVVFGLYASIIGYQIARGENHWRITPQIAVLAFFTYWSSQFLFPAGMFNPDTHFSYVPNIHTILESGRLPSSGVIYAGHYAFATLFSMMSGLVPQTGYYLLSTLLLVVTIPILSIVSYIFPRITHRTALYGALIFSISSWMLRRGMHPNKLNFFYALILLLGFVAVQMYQSDRLSYRDRNAWLAVGFSAIPALVFGHQFSAGAAMVFLLSIVLFSVSSYVFSSNFHPFSSVAAVFIFAVTYVLAVLGNPIHQGPLLGRFSNIVLSIVQSENTTYASSALRTAGGPGRYSQMPIEFLITSTAAQAILFGLAVIGAVWMFRERVWEYDLVIFWLGVLSLLLTVSLVENSADTQPQRFYAYLLLFGFNVCIGVLFSMIDNSTFSSVSNLAVDKGRIVVLLLVCVLAVTSLASPIADEVTSPVAEDLPHNRKFTTVQEIEGNQWSDSYLTNPTKISPNSVDVSVHRTGANSGVANLSASDSGTVLTYSSLANRTGVIVSGGLSFGGRDFVFVDDPQKPTYDQIYSNGGESVYII